MQWVISAYTLTLSALLLIGGAAADQFGRRNAFAVGVLGFAGASLACATARSVAWLIMARAFQGAGAALLVPGSLALIGASFAETERGKAIGIWSGASAIAAGLAPLLGGWLIDHSSWRVIFLINPVLAVPTLWITWRQVPDSRDQNAPRSLDWLGALLALSGLASLVYGLIGSAAFGWRSPLVIGTLSAGAALLIGFVAAEHAARSPMMPLPLYRSSAFSGINLITLLLYGALGGAFFYLPFLLIQARGYSATTAGAAYLPFTLVLAALSRWSGGLLDRFGARAPIMVGTVIAALGFLLLLLTAGGSPYWSALLAMTVLGFGMALTVAPLTATVLNAVPADRTGVASGINNAAASVAGLLAIALFGSTGRLIFWLAAALALVGALTAWLMIPGKGTPGLPSPAASQSTRAGNHRINMHTPP
jgi:EmrB/QacA subfamily drug resistance transporter